MDSVKARASRRQPATISSGWAKVKQRRAKGLPSTVSPTVSSAAAKKAAPGRKATPAGTARSKTARLSREARRVQKKKPPCGTVKSSAPAGNSVARARAMASALAA